MGTGRISFVFLMDFGDLAGPLGSVGPPAGMVLAGFVPTVICAGFKGGQSEIEVKSK